MAASLAQCTVPIASRLTVTTKTTNVCRQQRAGGAAVSASSSTTRRGGLPRAAHHHKQQQAAISRRGGVAPLRASVDDAAEATTTKPQKEQPAKGKGAGKGGKGGSKGGKGDGKAPSKGPSKNEEARKALMLALEKGEPVSGRVEVANRGGLILRIFNGRFRAFLPLSQMASSRTAGIKGRHTHAPTTRTGPLASFDDSEDDEDTFEPPAAAIVAPEKNEKTQKDATVAAMESQVGTCINVKVTSVDDKKIVVSERALVQDRGAKALKVGVRASGRVVSLSDFGAFVELSEDDPQAPRLEGLIHISELSWNRISHPRDVVRVGEEVDVKVLDIVQGEKGGRPARVTFSLKQLQADPLLETLDTIMPVAMPEPSVDEDELLDTPLPGLLDICANLLTEDGIDAVIPGRQAVEQRVVSQDLELWLTNVVVDDGYNLLARAGRQVQEIHVVTGLDRDAIKRAIKRATSALK